VILHNNKFVLSFSEYRDLCTAVEPPRRLEEIQAEYDELMKIVGDFVNDDCWRY
jgi:hypothetical protein